MRIRLLCVCCVLVIARAVTAAPVTVVPGSPAGYLYLPAAGTGGGDSDAALAAASAASCTEATAFSGSVVFNTPGGPFNWTVPASVGCIRIEAVGAGAGGAQIFYVAARDTLVSYPAATAMPVANSTVTTSAYAPGMDGGNSYVMNAANAVIAAGPGGQGGSPVVVTTVDPNQGNKNNAILFPGTQSFQFTPWPTLTGYTVPAYAGGVKGINEAYVGTKALLDPIYAGYKVDVSKGTWSIYVPSYGWVSAYRYYTARGGSGQVGYKAITPNFKIAPKSVLSVYVGAGGSVGPNSPGAPNPISPKAGSAPAIRSVLYPPTYDRDKAENMGGASGVGQSCTFDTSSGALSDCTAATAGSNGYVKIYY